MRFQDHAGSAADPLQVSIRSNGFVPVPRQKDFREYPDFRTSHIFGFCDGKLLRRYADQRAGSNAIKRLPAEAALQAN